MTLLKKIFPIVIFLAFLAPGLVFAIPSSVNRITDHIEPLIPSDYFKVQYITTTSTTATSTFAGSILVQGTTTSQFLDGMLKIGGQPQRPLIATSSLVILVGPTRSCTTIQCALNRVPYFMEYPVQIDADDGDYSGEDIILWPSYGARVNQGGVERITFQLIGSTTNPSAVKVGSILATGLYGDYFGINGFEVQHENPYDNENSYISIYGSKEVAFNNLLFTGSGERGITCYNSYCAPEANIDFGTNVLTGNAFTTKRFGEIDFDSAYPINATGTVMGYAFNPGDGNIVYSSATNFLTGTAGLVDNSGGYLYDRVEGIIYGVGGIIGLDDTGEVDFLVPEYMFTADHEGTTISYATGSARALNLRTVNDGFVKTQISLFDRNTSQGQIDFSTASTAALPTVRVTITPGGQVGIGTSTPLGILQVGNNSAADKFVTFVTSNDDERGINYYLANGSTIRGFMKWDANEDLLLKGDDIFFNNLSLSNTLVIKDVTGNIGIGNVSPIEKLNVQGKIAGQALFATSTAMTSVLSGGLYVTSTTTLANATSSAFAITTIPSAILKTTSSGSIISAIAGTDYVAPGDNTLKEWQIVSGTYLSPTSTIQSIGVFGSSTIGDGTGAGGLTVYGSGTTTGRAYFSGNVGVSSSTPFGLFSVEQGTETNSLIVANTGSSSPALIIKGINGDGFVGIGNNAPVSRLTVGDGSANIVQTLTINGDGAANKGVDIQRNGTTEAFFRVDSNEDLIITNARANEFMAFQTDSGGGDTTRLTIQPTGRIGVGTTTPFALFAVHAKNGDINESLFEVASSTATVDTVFFKINNRGNIGIATTSPYLQYSQVTTEVTGGTPVAIWDTTAKASASGGPILFFAHGGQRVTFIKSASGTGNASPFLSFGVGLNSGDPTEVARFDENGNLGVGTTTPWARVSIVSATAPPFVVASSTATGSNGPLFMIQNSGHIISYGKAPTLTSCGTSPTVVGNDADMIITVGSVAATGCTITFATAYATTPACSITNLNLSVVNGLTATVSNTAIVITQTGLTGSVLNIMCHEPHS